MVGCVKMTENDKKRDAGVALPEAGLLLGCINPSQAVMLTRIVAFEEEVRVGPTAQIRTGPARDTSHPRRALALHPPFSSLPPAVT